MFVDLRHCVQACALVHRTLTRARARAQRVCLRLVVLSGVISCLSFFKMAFCHLWQWSIVLCNDTPLLLAHCFVWAHSLASLLYSKGISYSQQRRNNSLWKGSNICPSHYSTPSSFAAYAASPTAPLPSIAPCISLCSWLHSYFDSDSNLKSLGGEVKREEDEEAEEKAKKLKHIAPGAKTAMVSNSRAEWRHCGVCAVHISSASITKL